MAGEERTGGLGSMSKYFVFLFIYLWSLEYFPACIGLSLSVTVDLSIILSQLVQELSTFCLSGHQSSREQWVLFYLFKNKQKHPMKNKLAKDNAPWVLNTAFIYLVMKDVNKTICMGNTKCKHTGNDWFQS